MQDDSMPETVSPSLWFTRERVDTREPRAYPCDRTRRARRGYLLEPYAIAADIACVEQRGYRASYAG